MIVRNLSTPETRAFWAAVEASAAEVRTWPKWKRDMGMLSIRPYPPEPPANKCAGKEHTCTK